MRRHWSRYADSPAALLLRYSTGVGAYSTGVARVLVSIRGSPAALLLRYSTGVGAYSSGVGARTRAAWARTTRPAWGRYSTGVGARCSTGAGAILDRRHRMTG